MRKILLVAGVVSAFVQAFGASATSATSVVWTKPEESLQWKTVMSASAPVTLNWPAGAVSARLTATANGESVGSATVTDTSVKEATVLPASLPTEYGDERLVDVTVEYLDGSDEVIESARARLGYVTGIGSNPTRLIPSAAGKGWTVVDKYAVLPIPDETSTFTVDSEAQVYDAPGWWEWRRIRSGEHALSLTAGGKDYLASLMGKGGGFFLIVR